jgi:hypothetical protein
MTRFFLSLNSQHWVDWAHPLASVHLYCWYMKCKFSLIFSLQTILTSSPLPINFFSSTLSPLLSPLHIVHHYVGFTNSRERWWLTHSPHGLLVLPSTLSEAITGAFNYWKGFQKRISTKKMVIFHISHTNPQLCICKIHKQQGIVLYIIKPM